jgi:hypothetical protein
MAEMENNIKSNSDLNYLIENSNLNNQLASGFKINLAPNSNVSLHKFDDKLSEYIKSLPSPENHPGYVFKHHNIEQVINLKVVQEPGSDIASVPLAPYIF